MIGWVRPSDPGKAQRSLVIFRFGGGATLEQGDTQASIVVYASMLGRDLSPAAMVVQTWKYKRLQFAVIGN